MNRPYRITLLTAVVVCAGLIAHHAATNTDTEDQSARHTPTISSLDGAQGRHTLLESRNSAAQDSAGTHLDAPGAISSGDQDRRTRRQPTIGLPGGPGGHGETVVVEPARSSPSRETAPVAAASPPEANSHAAIERTSTPGPIGGGQADHGPSGASPDVTASTQLHGLRDAAPSGLAPARPGSPATANAPQTHVIQPGDTYCSIAATAYGSQAKWVHIKQANPAIDPARLQPGQVINLPPLNPATPRVATAATSSDNNLYTVRPNDTLSKIARAKYGDGSEWTRIYRENRDRIGPDPDQLEPGTTLRLARTKTNGTSRTP